MVLTLLEDAQLEVRVQAAKVVSGLLHCNFILEPTALLVRIIYFLFYGVSIKYSQKWYHKKGNEVTDFGNTVSKVWFLSFTE